MKDEADCKFTNEDEQSIWNLIQHRLSNGGFRNNYDKYSNETFESFINNQTQIILDLSQIYFSFRVIHGLLLTPFYIGMMEEGRDKISDNLFKLFKNMRELIIYARQHPISITYLLGSVEIYFLGNYLKITIKSNVNLNGDSWVAMDYEKLQKVKKIDRKYEMFEILLNKTAEEHVLTINYGNGT